MIKPKFKVGDVVVKIYDRTWHIREISKVEIATGKGGHGHNKPYPHYFFKEKGCADESEMTSLNDAIKKLEVLAGK